MHLRIKKLGIKLVTGVLAAVQFFAPAMTVYAATNDSSTPTAPRVVAKNPVDDSATILQNHVPAPKMDAELKSQALKNDSVTATRISEADGNKIDSFETFWRTDNGKVKGNRTLVWHDNGKQSLAYSMNYALSGKQPYEPGTIVIRVPKTIFSDRSGRPMGYMSFGVPQAPDRNACFAYTETDTEYVISNVKRLSAASSGYIEATVHGITPSEVKDLVTGYKSKQLVPVIEITTVKGTQLSAEAPALSANVDTSGSIYGDYLKHDVSISDKFPKDWDVNIKPTDADKYYYGTFTSYANSNANQYFDVRLSLDACKSDDSRGAVILGVRNNRTGQVFKGNGIGKLDVTLEQNTYLSDGNNFMNTVYVAYPKDRFTTNRQYNLSLSNKYTMETVDDHTVTSTESLDTLPFTPVETEVPIGDFYVTKQGYGPDVKWDDWSREGIYDTALNKICAGKKVDVHYWLQSRSHAGKYTLKDGGNPRNINDYGKKSFEMITTDENLSLGDMTLNGDDAEFKGLDFGTMLQGYVFTDLSDTNKVHNEITGSDFTVGDGTRLLFGYKNVSKDRLPVVKVLTKHKGSDKYEEAGSVDYRSGKAVVHGINGNQAKDAMLLFTPDTTGYKLQVAMALSGYAQDVNVLVTLKPSERVKKFAKDLCKDTKLPLAYLSNKAGLDVIQDKRSKHINDYTGRNRLMGFASGVKASKKLVEYKNDVRNSNVNLTYELTNTLQTNLLSINGIKQAVKDGWMKEQTKGTFYDLLPKGVMPVTSSVRTLRDGDSIENIRVIENYRNTGRMMLIVKIHQTPDYRYYYRDDNILGVKGYYDAPSIQYDARYNWFGLKTYGNLLSNVMAYDSNVDSGIVTGLQSEYDVDSGRNQFTKYVLNDDDKKAFSDLHGNLTFAKSVDRVRAETSGLTNFVKQVDVNNESLFNDGLDEHVAKNVYANGRYTYMISVRTPDNTGAKNMIFYDSIENFKPKDENKDDATWRGRLESINLDSLIGAGVNPVVYYSTKKGLVLDNENNRADLDLNNTSIWSKTKPEAEAITAIAVDARKMTDGSPFILSSNNAVNFKLNMKAPKTVSEDMFDKVLEKGQKEAGMNGGAHAYNNAVLTSNPVSNAGSVGSGVLIHNDYTKVGLKPFKIGVEKTWNDDNDRDGLRKNKAEVELYANDKPTGKKLTLSDENHWKGNFGQVPYLDDRGAMIAYTVKEKGIKGYYMTIKDQKINDDSLTFKISNEHDPEKININGEKIWTDSSAVKRPESIGVILKADGKIIRQLDVRPVNGKWLYDFGQLFKYRDKGKEIRYELFEKDYVTGYVTKIEGFNVHNIYDPFTTVAIQKQVSDATAESQKINPDFTFRFNVTDLKKQIVNETYNYITSLGRSGKLSVGQDFTLKDKEVMTLSHVPSERVVNVTETKLPDGYKLDGIDGNNVILQAGKPVIITAKNRYVAAGQIKIHMNKLLTGRALKPYEFKFELLEDGKNNFVTAAATNDAKGGIDFYMPYSNKDSGTDRHYVIREVDGALGGVTYDKKTYPITVHISDDGKGKIIGTVEGDKRTFKNDYHAKGTVELKAWKVMSDHSKPKDGAYSFELLQDGKVIKSVANDKDGGISFPLDFTEKNVGKTYNYTVREVMGNNSDVIYDTHTVDYSVTVFDRGDGMLDFKTTAKDNYTDDEHNDANSPVFYNKVKDGSLTISKAVQKGDPAETFKFKVKLKGQNVRNGNYHITRKKNIVEPSLTANKTDKNAEVSDKKSELSVGTDKSKLNESNKAVKSAKPVEANMSKKDLHDFKFDLKGWKSARTDAATGSEEHSGVCGTVKWSIDKNGTLLLEPVSGDRGDFGGSIQVGLESMIHFRVEYSFGRNGGSYSTAPWLDYGESIKKVQTRGTIIAPEDCGGLFVNCGIKELDMDGFDTSKTIMMDSMFQGCSKLTSLAGLEKWNTGNVTSMGGMFQGCSGLTSLAGLEKWNIENTTSLYRVFYGCFGLTSLVGLEKWNTKNITDMSGMFHGCSGLTSLVGLEKWNTGNVTDMRDMFVGCSKLASLKALTDWDTKNVKNFGRRDSFNDRIDGMFSGCSGLTSLAGLEKWNTGNVTDMIDMFHGCSKLTSLVELAKWNIRNVTNMSNVFSGCSGLTSLVGLEKWNTGKVKFMQGVFEGCSKLTSLKALTDWDTKNVRSFADYNHVDGMFSGCSSLTSLVEIEKWNTNNVRHMNYMFSGCSGLTSLAGLEKWNTGRVTDMDGVFQGCYGLTSLAGLEKWNTGNAIRMNNMFKNCFKLASIEALADWDVKNVRYFGNDDIQDAYNGMFSGCLRLTSLIPLKKWNTKLAKNMNCMFSGCSGLTSLAGLEKWDTRRLMSMTNMFFGCSSLTSLVELDKWNTRRVKRMDGMFQGCSGLISAEFGDDFVTTDNSNMSYMFDGCRNLSRVKISKLPKESVQYIKQLSTYEQEGRTDKWIREDKAYGPYTSEEMYNNWMPDMAGWWIRETASTNYTVQFDFQGSGQSEKAYVATKDKDVVLPKITIEPAGKTFKGWSLTKDGSVITSLKNLAQPGHTVTLYAIWDSLPDNVDINNGEFTVEVPAGEAITIDGLSAGTDYEVEEFQKDVWVKVQEMNSIGKILSNKDQQAIFVNHYDPQKKQVSVNLQAKKFLDGKSAGGFEFELLENGKVIDKATSQFDGTISFTPINYSEAGHHEYQVREVAGNDKSITYDTSVRTITVDVTEVDGKLHVQTTKAPVFNNTTKTGSLDITKVIDNRNDTTISFNFVLTIDGKDEQFSLKAGEHNIINNLPIGTAYLLKEVNISQGYSQVKIDNPAGAIKENETTKVIVTNTYHYSGFAQFKAHKVLEGGKLTSGQFTFRLSKDGQKVQDVQNDGNGDIIFDAVEFNKPGTYHYTISEVGSVQGIKMDNHVIKADVTATAQDDGTLKVDVKYDGDTTFTNKVVPDEPIIPKRDSVGNVLIKKTVVGPKTNRPFLLWVRNEYLDSVNDTSNFKVTSDKGFKHIVYTRDGYPATAWQSGYVLVIHDGETLTIHDMISSPDGRVSINIAEADYPEYKCEKRMDTPEHLAVGDCMHITITNTYRANGQFTPKGTKKLLGGNVHNYRFKFLVLKDDDIVSTGYNDGENIYFKPIYYTEKDLGKTYTYTVIEDTGTNPSISYDTDVKTVKVTVKDNGDGTITAVPDVQSVTFTNKLIPNLPVTGTIVTACILAGLTITLSLVCLVKRKH